MDQSPATSGGVWEQLRDPATGNVFFANRLLSISRWDRPPGVESIPLPPPEPQQQRHGAAAAAPDGQSDPPPPNLTLRQFLRPLEKAHDGRWVKSASLAADATQRKQVAMEMIVVLAAQFLEEDPDVIRKTCVNEDGLIALASALLARVNW